MMKDPNKQREELKKIYQDTLEVSKLSARPLPTRKWKWDHLRNNPIQLMSSELKDYSIEVVDSDTITQAIEHSNDTDRVCILNMASPKKPGGGVSNGARAQEECIFRCTNAALSVDKSFYPLKGVEVLYTQGLSIIKNKDYELIKPVRVDMITASAVNLSKGFDYNDSQLVEKYLDETYGKIKLMIALAVRYKVDVLILGAWGCGVFKNNPHLIANMFNSALSEFKVKTPIKKVVFAVINDHNSVSDNYSVFRDIIGTQYMFI